MDPHQEALTLRGLLGLHSTKFEKFSIYDKRGALFDLCFCSIYFGYVYIAWIGWTWTEKNSAVEEEVAKESSLPGLLPIIMHHGFPSASTATQMSSTNAIPPGQSLRFTAKWDLLLGRATTLFL